MADSKYPVRYVLLGIKEKYSTKTITGVEEYYGDVFAYTVARAYVINEIKTYSQKGGFTTSYDVVPEWTIDGEENEPKFNMYGRCYNTINVTSDLVYGDYEQAKSFCKKMNNTLMNEHLEKLSGEFLGEKKKEYKEKLLEIERIEKEHLKAVNNKKR